MENKMEETEIEKEGFWDYARMTIASLVAVAFLCILGVHFFFGIDVLYRDGHFSYELGNHPGRTEITKYLRGRYSEHSAKILNAECKNPVWFEPVSVASFEEVEGGAVWARKMERAIWFFLGRRMA